MLVDHQSGSGCVAGSYTCAGVETGLQPTGHRSVCPVSTSVLARAAPAVSTNGFVPCSRTYPPQKQPLDEPGNGAEFHDDATNSTRSDVCLFPPSVVVIFRTLSSNENKY
jgi:hypothetical protein